MPAGKQLSRRDSKNKSKDDFKKAKEIELKDKIIREERSRLQQENITNKFVITRLFTLICRININTRLT